LATTEDRRIQGKTVPLDEAVSEQLRSVRLSRLYRWGVVVARRRRVVLGAYAFVLLLCAGMYPTLQKALGPPGYQVKNSDSWRVEQLLESRFPGLGSETDALVFNSSRHLASEPAYRAVIEAVDRAVRGQKGVRTVLGPYDAEAAGQIAAGEHTAVTAVSLAGSADQRFNRTSAIQDAVTRAAGDRGVHAWLTGYSPIAKNTSEVQQADTKRAQEIGMPLALLILLLAMGALVAAILPLLFAIVGLLLADGVLTVLTLFFHFDSLLLAVTIMIGLGIGIDYALFIVSRFREELARASREEGSESQRVADAVGIALATSGRTIIFSGVIVTFSLASLFIVNSRFLQEIAVGAVVVVMCMLAAALTLLPAVLSLLGQRVNRGALSLSMQPADARSGAGRGRGGGWARWALLIMRHPIPAASTMVVLLIVAAVPVFHLRYGADVGVLRNTSTISGKGEKVLAQSYGPGVVAPIQIIVTDPGSKYTYSEVVAAKRLGQGLERDPRVTGLVERQSGAGVLLTVFPSVPIDSSSATALVEHIRKKLAPTMMAHRSLAVLVGGSTGQVVDISNELRSKFPLILALILGSSLLFLLLAFRSIVLPIKAVLMNLLATGATMGLVILIFQDGYGRHLLNFTRTGFIQVGVPQLMFALLFGLSMDYEVFLIRRIQEEWRKTGDNQVAVATGMEHTARPITAAAAIMVAVFGSSVVANQLELKQLGFTLAAAVAIDATLVRLILVPAMMRLFGAWNWWLPDWLARVLPNLGVD
jgi:putative drug exporter of the RND superfamily